MAAEQTTADLVEAAALRRLAALIAAGDVTGSASDRAFLLGAATGLDLACR